MLSIVVNEILKRNCLSRLTSPLPLRIVTKIVSIAAITIAAIVVITCVSSPISYIIGGILGIIALVTFSLVIISEIKKATTYFPKGFLNVIKKEFPEVIFKLITKKRLTLPELRIVLSALSQPDILENNIKKFPKELSKKIICFGLERLKTGIQSVELPSLELVLMKNCPFYTLKKLIDAGDKEPLSVRGYEEKNKGYYWLGAAGMDNESNNPGLFDFRLPGILQELTKEEYEILRIHASLASWEDPSVEAVIMRLGLACKKYEKKGTTFPVLLSDDVKVSISKQGIKNLLLRLCLTGYSWEQLLLLRNIDVRTWNWLCVFDSRGRSGRSIAFVIGLLYVEGLLNEYDERYSPHIHLITFDELINVMDWGESFIGRLRFGFWPSESANILITYIATFFSLHLRRVLRGADSYQLMSEADSEVLSPIKIDLKTGAIEFVATA
ncbi:DUF1389 domain-containing protein [Chlamydia sp. 17-3921]|uniref:DUF1389 domain-containing protein n=1 Tax=Chlamydia sp. 17-3921 TaxID=2675798 RepID=UPI001917DE00|nr:DUF1389 domain-containing protein [Chlamydia sp. 17-3921]